MSGETEQKVQSVFLDKLGAKYPFALIKSSTKQDYGVRGYPSYYLIGPDGVLRSQGSPSDAQIEQLLKDVSLTPKLPEDSRYDPIVRMWERSEHEKLRDYLDKMLAQDDLDAEMREVFVAQQQELQKRAARMSDRVTRLGAGPDYLAAERKLEKIEDEWQGFPAGEKAATELRRFQRDSDIKKEIKLQERLAKLLERYPATSIVKTRKQQEQLQRFVERYDGSYAADQARKLIR